MLFTFHELQELLHEQNTYEFFTNLKKGNTVLVLIHGAYSRPSFFKRAEVIGVTKIGSVKVKFLDGTTGLYKKAHRQEIQYQPQIYPYIEQFMQYSRYEYMLLEVRDMMKQVQLRELPKYEIENLYKVLRVFVSGDDK